MIVTAHQANYFPGLSVIEKLAVSDAVIWLDSVQFTHGGYSNRNRMPDGSWLTVPIRRTTNMAPFNKVKIAEHGLWRRDHVRSIRQHYGESVGTFVVCSEIERPYGLLIGLNLALLRILCDGLAPETAWHFQSHLDGGNAVRAVSESEEELLPISERLAMMVAELGGDTYLSGPSGRNYLSEEPFHERGIEVDYFRWEGENPCSLGRLASLVRA